MQWVRWAMGQDGDVAAHLVHSGAVVSLVVSESRRMLWRRYDGQGGPVCAFWSGDGYLKMSYRVLARTYRSTTFHEVVGQEAIATTLTNAITSGRVHHGYLFTGTRGVGKTSMARILAKALNCRSFDAPTAEPCCQCDSCVAVAEGEDVDVVEIDAASNTGVDNIRELRDNASLRPARARFKVYIIDEVHMLSTGAFNALLKTLEEPPAHVKFILATTESQKVPATIQSRCQRFDFRAINSDAIVSHLRRLLTAEQVEAEEPVLRRVARLARGSMRDALSLLDKLLSYESKHLTTDIVDAVLPPPHDELAGAVMDAVADRNPASALSALDTALQTGRTVDRFCEHLIEHLRTLMLIHVCGVDTDLVDVSVSLREQLQKQASRFDAPTYTYMIALLEELRRNARSTGASRALADAAIVRLALSHQYTDIDTLLAGLTSDVEEPELGATASTSAASPQTSVPPPASGTSEPTPAPTPKRSGKAGITANEASKGPPSPPPIASKDQREALEDPLVQKVKETFDGTLFSIRRNEPAQDHSADFAD